MTTRPPSSFSSPSSSPAERRSLSPDLPDNFTVTHTFSHYSGFKYRLWFIWYTWNHWSERWESPPWLDIIGDLWLYEDEDEEYIKNFIEDEEYIKNFIDSEDLFVFPELFPELRDWGIACWYLEKRLAQTTVAATLFVHLTPQIRLRFMTWLLVALRRTKMSRNNSIPSIAMLVYDWAKSIRLPLRGTCHACRVSDVLSVWMETMLEVYSRDDVGSLPWDLECNCLHR
jgi:hypothetical protein